MKTSKIILTLGAMTFGIASAQAADLPVKAPPMAAMQVPFSCDRFYIGGHAGAKRGRADYG